jgi:hypothetical protein
VVMEVTLSRPVRRLSGRIGLGHLQGRSISQATLTTYCVQFPSALHPHRLPRRNQIHGVEYMPATPEPVRASRHPWAHRPSPP